MMNKQTKILVRMLAFLLPVLFMLFGPSDAGGNLILKGLLIGAAIGTVGLAARLLFMKQSQATESERIKKQEE
jgi:hypothetical protein